ncbi:choice-of-anchor D domain-containing protein [Halomonas denitrificans]|nr:choice-of-anchor D domain-containing protein [Halomonas denitrificans]
MKLRFVLGLWLAAASSLAFAQQVLVEESFSETTAPGFLILSDAVLTANTVDAPGSGWLRLTGLSSPSGTGVGGAIYDTAFASTNGIQVTFDYATYGGNGADGLTFFLIDGATTNPALGTGGGALGYAGTSDGSSPGVTNGYIGLALDEFGNFAGPGAGSCNEIPCNGGVGVSIRGSGDTNDPNGFNLLSYTPFSVPTGSRVGARPVRLTITPAPAVTLTLEIDSGSGFQTIVNALDITSANFSTQAPIPPTFKLGFAGSIGGLNNIHEIRNLRVTQAGLTVTPNPLDFGDVNVSTSSGSQTVLVENTSVFDIQVSDITAATAPFTRFGGTCPNATPFTVTANSSCTIEYSFGPDTTGVATQTLTITSDAPSSPDDFELRGNGVQPALTIAPDPQDFGEQAVGTTSAPANVTLTNSGSGTLQVSNVAAVSAPFAAAGGSCGSAPFTIAAGNSCTLAYTFSPTAAGVFGNFVQVDSDAPSSPETFDLLGVGTEPNLAITPNPQDFGDQEVGTTSIPASVTLFNGGSADLDVSAVDAAAAPFAVAGGSCGAAPFTITAGSSCTIDYTFAPTAMGPSSQSISVSSNAPFSPDAFELRGNGTQAALTISPNPLDFGDQEVGTTSPASTVTLSNGGSADLDVSAVDAAAAPFAVAGGTCGAAPFTVPAGGSCTIDYTFAPTATGAASQSITVTSNSATSPDSFTLQGNGTQATLTVSPNPQDFGDQEVGTTSPASTVTLSNGGSADLDVSAVDAAAAPFAVAGGSCGAAPFTVPAGGSCTIDYTFAPTTTGAASQSITVTSNSATSPDSFTLEGNGTEAVVTLDVTSLSLQVDFGGSATATVNVTNDGAADLTISDIADLAFPFSFDGGSCFAVPTTLVPGESCSIDVLFDPGTVSGSFLDSFDIVSNAASSPDTVTLQGTAGDAIAIPALDRTGLILLALLMISIGGLVVRRAA